MSGTVIRIGRYRSSSGPDLATVGSSEQIASFTSPASHSSQLILYRAGAWIGRYSGNPRARLGLLWHASDSNSPNGLRPGGVAAYSNEMVPSAAYTGANEGQQMVANLTSPFLTSANYAYTIAITNSSGVLGTAMYQASAISEPNEWFYRKSISGNVPVDGVNSATSNEGQLVGWFEGEANVAPAAPTSMSPSGNIGSRTPAIAGNFNDANKVLNNGVAWDRPEATQIQVRRVSGSVMMWDYTYTTSSSERSNQRTSRTYAGSALLYEIPYEFRIRHRDRAGAWGAWSGWQSFVIKYNNRKPNIPSSFTGLGTHYGTKSLTVGSNFTDPDLPTLPDGQAYERFEYKQVRVRRQADNVLVYNPGAVATTTTEKNNKRSFTTYTLPAYNIPYIWEERHRDRFGAWSDWATASVIAYSGGSVEQPSSPSGRVTNFVNPGDISFVYTNTGALNGNMIRVGVAYPNGGFRSQRDLAMTVTQNATTTVTWAQLWSGISEPGFPFQEEGTDWLYAVRVRDTAGTWTDYSPFQELNLNAAPLQPRLYGPNADPRSALPELSVRVTDPDQPPHEVTVEIEVYNDTNTLLDTVNVPLNTGHSLNDLYTVSVATLEAIIPDYGSYRWRAQANDGYLNSPWSEMFTLNYYPVPAVEITSPAGPVITTSQPMFTWESTDQTAWRVQGRDGERLVYDTGEQSGADQQHLISSTQYWIGGERWNNHESFEWVVQVQDSSTLWGSSNLLPLTLEYIVPDPLIVEGVVGVLPGVEGTHYAVLNHTQTNYVQDEFIAYVWSRVEIEGPGGNEVPGTYIAEFVRNTNGSNLTLVDFDLTSNQWYRWGVRQEVQQGVDVITSDPVYVELMVSWRGTLLHMPFDPLNNYVWLQYGKVGDEYEPSREHGMNVTRETDFNGDVHNYIMGKPTVSPSGEYTFMTSRTSESPTAMQQLDTLYRMFVYQNPKFSPDGRPHGLCWREGRGGLNGRQYVMLANWRDTTTIDGTQSVELEFIPNVNGGGQ